MVEKAGRPPRPADGVDGDPVWVRLLCRVPPGPLGKSGHQDVAEPLRGHLACPGKVQRSCIGSPGPTVGLSGGEVSPRG